MFSDNPSSMFVDSYVNMMNFNSRYLTGPDELILYERATMSWHESARNQLVEKSQGKWLFQMDTDHTFAPDVLSRLLRLQKKYKTPVLSGLYLYKFQPHSPVAGLWSEPEKDGQALHVKMLTQLNIDEEVMDVGVVGGGCLLVERWVFDEMSRKYKTGPFSIIQGLSEDYSFCYRCRDMGIPIKLAVNVEYHHIIPTVLSVVEAGSYKERV